MPKVQSPVIGNALRTALDLDAAGGMPMESDTTIIPVAIVADVRELLSTKYIPVQQTGSQSAVAGEYSYTFLEWVPNSAPKPRRLLLDSITISNPATAGSIFLGFSTTGVPGSMLGLPRRKVGSLQQSSVAGRVVSGTNISAPQTIIDGYAGRADLVIGVTLEIVFREPIILDAEGQYFGVGFNAVNTGIRTWFQWREERP